MAAAVKPSPPPPPPGIVVAVLVFVRFVLDPMLSFGRVFLVAARALPYLGFASSWVFSASLAAMVVARRTWGEGSAPFVFLQALSGAALKSSICIIFLLFAFLAVLLCGLCLVSLVAVVSGSSSEFKKSTFGEVTQESTQKSFRFPRAVVLGLVADLLFILLIVAGILVVTMSSPVKGSISEGERIGSVIVDVGAFGLHVVSCFVIIPAVVLSFWRKGQADRKEPSQFC